MNFKVRDLINEPASLVSKIVNAAESREDKSTDIDLIYCRLSKPMPEHSERVSKDLLNLIKDVQSKGIIKNDIFFLVLKNRRYISAKDIYHIYWEKVADDMTSTDPMTADEDQILSTLSYRYTLIQKGILNKYRCKKFESLLKELALIQIKYGLSAWKPNQLSKLATFLIGYAYDPTTEYVTLPDYFVRKVEEMASQFTVNEVIDISMGIENFHRNGLPKR